MLSFLVWLLKLNLEATWDFSHISISERAINQTLVWGTRTLIRTLWRESQRAAYSEYSTAHIIENSNGRRREVETSGLMRYNLWSGGPWRVSTDLLTQS